MTKLRLVVADDELLVRQGLCGLLALEPDFEVVGQAANGEEAIDAVRRLRPDIVLMDIQMPVMNGVEATRTLLDNNTDVKILILTTFADDALVAQALLSGARGYLLKDSGSKQLAAAIRSAALGHTAVGGELGARLVAGATLRRKSRDADLTERELQVLRQLGQGLTNKEIADRLQITEKTVRDHVSNILASLNLRDRTQAALWAQEHLCD